MAASLPDELSACLLAHLTYFLACSLAYLITRGRSKASLSSSWLETSSQKPQHRNEKNSFQVPGTAPFGCRRRLDGPGRRASGGSAGGLQEPSGKEVSNNLPSRLKSQCNSDSRLRRSNDRLANDGASARVARLASETGRSGPSTRQLLWPDASPTKLKAE